MECKVKGATIKREFFGMEKHGTEIARIKGEVNADFLPITSDRTNFIKDLPEYEKFLQVMKKVMERVEKVLGQVSDYRENRRTKRTLTQVLEMVKRALVLNPDYCPQGLLPIGDEAGASGQAGLIQKKRAESQTDEENPLEKQLKLRKKRKKKPKVGRLSPTAIVKRLKLGQQGVSCCVDHLSKDGPECHTEGTVIYLNRDHPLFQKEAKTKTAFILYVARLITQEISLMKNPRSPRHAYRMQSKLLRDALME